MNFSSPYLEKYKTNTFHILLINQMTAKIQKAAVAVCHLWIRIRQREEERRCPTAALLRSP